MTQMLGPLNVSASYRTPFDLDRPGTMMKFSPDLTLSQMVGTFTHLPPDFAARGDIMVGDHFIPREHWPRVKLKPGIKATFFYAPRGGGGGGGGKKSKGGILALVIGIATILTAGLALTGAFATGGLFLAGSTSAKLLAGAITIAGQLLAKAISAPPTDDKKSSNDDTKGAASASGNLLEAGAPIAAIRGTMKAFPSLLTQPYTYRYNGDEIVEAIFGFAGPHQWTSIKVGDSEIAGAQDIEYQTCEGWDDDSVLDLIQRYAVTKQPGLELSIHDVVEDDQQQLRNQTLYTASLPIFHGVAAAASPDQINIDLTFLEGLYDTTATDVFQRVPFRVRMRNLATGITYNLPEVHYTSKTAREIRLSIILKWAAALDSLPGMPANGWASAFYTVPAQVSPAMGGWQAHSSFYSGSGDTYLSRNNQGSSGVIRSYLTGTDEFSFHLNSASIPKGRYQIEIQRGTSVTDANFNPANYQYNGTVNDFMGYVFIGGTAMVVKKRVNQADRVGLVRISSVFNTHPINGGLQGSGLAMIAVKATNRAVENLSAIVSGYVQDWDGNGWDTWTTSSNPAAIYNDVLRGRLTPDPLESIVIDNDSLVEWRQACIDNAYTCNMICEGDALLDILRIVASCGYAQPRMSDTWGVIRDFDRSSDAPSQVFTAANSYGMTMENEFVRLPDALRVSFTDAAADYAAGEDIVYRTGVPPTADPRLEEMSYRGLVSLADARKRANFDLIQVEARAAKWTFNAPTEAIRSTRGDLVAINHDFISEFHDSGRIIDVEFDDDGNAITAVVMDRDVPVYNELDMLHVPDMLLVGDMFLVGAQTSISIRQSTSLISTHAVTGTGKRAHLQLTTPYALDLDTDERPTIRPDCLAWVGASGNEYKRLIISAISYDKNQTAQIEAVAEAPELWA